MLASICQTGCQVVDKVLHACTMSVGSWGSRVSNDKVLGVGAEAALALVVAATTEEIGSVFGSGADTAAVVADMADFSVGVFACKRHCGAPRQPESVKAAVNPTPSSTPTPASAQAVRVTPGACGATCSVPPNTSLAALFTVSRFTRC